MSDKFQKIMWGMMLTGCQLPMSGWPKLVPIIIGYGLIVWALMELTSSGAVHFERIQKSAITALVLAVITEGFYVFLGGQVITECVMILFYMEEILFFSDFMRAGRKMLVDQGQDKFADEFKKKRLFYCKVFLFVVVLKIVQAVAIGIIVYNNELYKECMLIYNVLNYAVITTALVCKIWFSTAAAKLAKVSGF